MSSNQELSTQQKYKLQQLEFKENNKTALCVVNLVSTVVTVGMAIATVSILSSSDDSCSDSKLRLTLWLMLGMHIINTTEAICGLTGFDKIFCGCLCVVGFFFYEVAVLVYMNVVYFNNQHCKNETPTQFYWLLANIVVYYLLLLVACYYHLRGLFGKPSPRDEYTKQ